MRIWPLGAMLLMVCCKAAPAPASAHNQNEAFAAAMARAMKDMQCPKAASDEVQRAMTMGELPGHIARASIMKPWSQQEIQIKALTSRPGMADLMLANPAMLSAMAAGMQMSEDDLRKALTGVGQAPRMLAFMTRTSATLAIDNRIPKNCDRLCETLIEWNGVAALSLWRNLCISRSDSFLTVISAGSKRWVAAKLLEWLRDPGPKSPERYPANGIETGLQTRVGRALATQAPGITSAVQPSPTRYQLPDDSDPVRGVIRSGGLRHGNRPPGHMALTQAICAAGREDQL